jgi:hypothetical protein
MQWLEQTTQIRRKSSLQTIYLICIVLKLAQKAAVAVLE